MKDQIVKIITDYLNKMEVPKEKWDGTVGFFPAEWPLPTCTIADEIAEKLSAAIAPHLEAGVGEQVKDLQVGAHVKIVAKIDTGDRFSHHFQIGHLGTITRVDLSDPLYQYLIDDHDYGWVLADEIELIG